MQIVYDGTLYFERWEQLSFLANSYFVSSLGRLKNIKDDGTQFMLGQFKSKKGYLMVFPYLNKVKQSFPIHRLVAFAFSFPKMNAPEVNHKDCNKINNCFFNLEWVSCKDNINHAIENGLRKRDANLKRGMFSTEQVLDIKNRLKNGESGTLLSKEYNCSVSTISKINVGINYPHITI